MFAMNFIMSRQAMWLEAIEKRISATSAMLSSMKGVKMCGLKDTLLASLQKLRVDELRISKKFRRLIIWNMIFGKPSVQPLCNEQVAKLRLQPT
jgi:ATP-binding cassette, subfamily C (CFTR/MRP), member 1